MCRYIEYDKKRYRKLTFHIAPSTDFQKILAQLNKLRFADCKITQEQLIYAVLELLNNSLRAHRERRQNLPIHLYFLSEKKGYEVYLQDWGGGFDPSRLPYDINEEADNIDIHDECFEAYRNKHEHTRFGMGLYLAKRTFNDFKLYFIDEDGMETSWEGETCAGTVVQLRTFAQARAQEREKQHEKSAHL